MTPWAKKESCQKDPELPLQAGKIAFPPQASCTVAKIMSVSQLQAERAELSAVRDRSHPETNVTPTRTPRFGCRWYKIHQSRVVSPNKGSASPLQSLRSRSPSSDGGSWGSLRRPEPIDGALPFPSCNDLLVLLTCVAHTTPASWWKNTSAILLLHSVSQPVPAVSKSCHPWKLPVIAGFLCSERKGRIKKNQKHLGSLKHIKHIQVGSIAFHGLNKRLIKSSTMKASLASLSLG